MTLTEVDIKKFLGGFFYSVKFPSFLIVYFQFYLQQYCGAWLHCGLLKNVFCVDHIYHYSKHEVAFLYGWHHCFLPFL